MTHTTDPAAAGTTLVLDAAGRRMSPRRRAQITRIALYVLLLAAFAALAFSIDWAQASSKLFNWDVVVQMLPTIPRAFLNTLIYGAGSFAIGITLGLILALMRLSSVGPYRWLATAYVEFFRGIPALLVVLTFGFAVPIAFGVQFPSILSMIAPALGMVSGAYVSETIRAGLLAVPKGQVEAARSLGMSSARTTITVVIPQAFRIVLPPLTNELILVIKDTSLVYALGMSTQEFELTKLGKDLISQASGGGLTPMFVLGLCYLVITLPLGFLSRWLERRKGVKGRK